MPVPRSLIRSTLALPLLLLALTQACGRGARPLANVEGDSTEREDPRAVYGVAAAQNVVVTPVEIEVDSLPPGWSDVKIAALSDFNLGLWPDNVNVASAAVRRAVAERPDFVVLLGDYVGRRGDFAALDRVLAPLRGMRVLAVLGHLDEVEDTNGKPDSVRMLTEQALRRNGVTVLHDNRVPVGVGGDTAYVAGVNPYVARKPDWRQAEIYGGLPGSPQTMLLLTHMPVAALGVPTGKYPVILGGHTFCGQVEVPGTPRLTWFNTTVLPGTADPARTRIYRVRGSTLFTTCGVGYSFVPVRYGYPPEVAIITLKQVGLARGPRPDSVKAQPNVDSLIKVFQERDTTAKADSTGA